MSAYIVGSVNDYPKGNEFYQNSARYMGPNSTVGVVGPLDAASAAVDPLFYRQFYQQQSGHVTDVPYSTPLVPNIYPCAYNASTIQEPNYSNSGHEPRPVFKERSIKNRSSSAKNNNSTRSYEQPTSAEVQGHAESFEFVKTKNSNSSDSKSSDNEDKDEDESDKQTSAASSVLYPWMCRGHNQSGKQITLFITVKFQLSIL